MSAMALAALLAAFVGAPPAQPSEIVSLGTQLGGNVEIPTLGTSDGDTIYCVYSQNVDSIWIQATRDGAKTWSEPVRVMGLPSPRYITDANILVDGKRLTVFATHVLETADSPGTDRPRSVFQVSVARTAAPVGPRRRCCPSSGST